MLVFSDKVSVIIPTYGGSESLIRTVESVLEQDYCDFEVIVVDDNNPETEARKNTEKIMSRYLNSGKVKYIKHEFNKNGSAARNTGFRASVGSFICLLDDDDIFLPGKIEKQVLYLKSHPEYGACYCWRKQFNKSICESFTGDLSEQLLDLSFTPTTSAIMIRKTCFEALNGFDESYRRHQDFEFMLRFYEQYKIGVVEEVLVEIIGNEVLNQLKGKKLYEMKVHFFSQFEHHINRIERQSAGFKKRVYAVHFANVCKELIRYGNFGLALKTYAEFGIKGGELFWVKFIEIIVSWIKRNI